MHILLRVSHETFEKFMKLETSSTSMLGTPIQSVSPAYQRALRPMFYAAQSIILCDLM